MAWSTSTFTILLLVILYLQTVTLTITDDEEEEPIEATESNPLKHRFVTFLRPLTHSPRTTTDKLTALGQMRANITDPELDAQLAALGAAYKELQNLEKRRTSREAKRTVIRQQMDQAKSDQERDRLEEAMSDVLVQVKKFKKKEAIAWSTLAEHELAFKEWYLNHLIDLESTTTTEDIEDQAQSNRSINSLPPVITNSSINSSITTIASVNTTAGSSIWIWILVVTVLVVLVLGSGIGGGVWYWFRRRKTGGLRTNTTGKTNTTGGRTGTTPTGGKTNTPTTGGKTRTTPTTTTTR